MRWPVPVFVENRCRSSSRGVSFYQTGTWQTRQKFFSAIVFVSRGNLVCIEEERRELWVYRGAYYRGRSPGAPGEAVAEDILAHYDGDLDEGKWR